MAGSVEVNGKKHCAAYTEVEKMLSSECHSD